MITSLWREKQGQAVAEFALVMPILVSLALGVAEAGHYLVDQHVVTRLTREGSNLTSRSTTLQDAAAAMTTMSMPPMNFSSDSKVIFSVIKRGATNGTSNYDQMFLYQRYEYGAFSGQSTIQTAGTPSFGSAPNYVAVNADNNANLRVTNVATDLVAAKGGMIYVTEIYNRHTLITPLDRFGIHFPTTLYSIAYF